MISNKVPYHTGCVSYRKYHFKAIDKNGKNGNEKKRKCTKPAKGGGGEVPPDQTISGFFQKNIYSLKMT